MPKPVNEISCVEDCFNLVSWENCYWGGVANIAFQILITPEIFLGKNELMSHSVLNKVRRCPGLSCPGPG